MSTRSIVKSNGIYGPLGCLVLVLYAFRQDQWVLFVLIRPQVKVLLCFDVSTSYDP